MRWICAFFSQEEFYLRVELSGGWLSSSSSYSNLSSARSPNPESAGDWALINELSEEVPSDDGTIGDVVDDVGLCKLKQSFN